MPRVEKVSIAVTAEMAAEMRRVVASGEFASASEVVRDALRVWNQRRTERAQAVEKLGLAWDAGIASGAPVDGETAFARMKARLESRLADDSVE
jgi:antitoxin ParD1/3/4